MRVGFQTFVIFIFIEKKNVLKVCTMLWWGKGMKNCCEFSRHIDFIRLISLTLRLVGAVKSRLIDRKISQVFSLVEPASKAIGRAEIRKNAIWLSPQCIYTIFSVPCLNCSYYCLLISCLPGDPH